MNIESGIEGQSFPVVAKGGRGRGANGAGQDSFRRVEGISDRRVPARRPKATHPAILSRVGIRDLSVTEETLPLSRRPGGVCSDRVACVIRTTSRGGVVAEGVVKVVDGVTTVGIPTELIAPVCPILFSLTC